MPNCLYQITIQNTKGIAQDDFDMLRSDFGLFIARIALVLHMGPMLHFGTNTIQVVFEASMQHETDVINYIYLERGLGAAASVCMQFDEIDAVDEYGTSIQLNAMESFLASIDALTS